VKLQKIVFRPNSKVPHIETRQNCQIGTLAAINDDNSKQPNMKARPTRMRQISGGILKENKYGIAIKLNIKTHPYTTRVSYFFFFFNVVLQIRFMQLESRRFFVES
jgi:hypothetical protein